MCALRLPNQHLNLDEEDFLYHFGISTEEDLAERFGDVKVSQ